MQAKRSLIGLLISLMIHGIIVGALFYSWYKPSESANSVAGELATTISMEMLQGMVVEETASAPEPIKAEPKLEAQETVADPTKKPEPEKNKTPEKKIEKPKEKIKEESKEKTPEKPVINPKKLPKGDHNVNSDHAVNSKATSIGAVNSQANVAGSGASSSELDAYRTALRREIEKHKVYPARARMMRKQGVVKIAFTIATDGSLNGERVIQSSGDESLDNSALEAIRRSRSIGPRPAGLGASMTVPINYNLQ